MFAIVIANAEALTSDDTDTIYDSMRPSLRRVQLFLIISLVVLYLIVVKLISANKLMSLNVNLGVSFGISIILAWLFLLFIKGVMCSVSKTCSVRYDAGRLLSCKA